LNLDLPQQVEAVIRAKKLFRDGQKILVAVSGGVDSMALLALLHRLAAAHRWRLTVAHFNHQLRGKAGDADEQLVRQQARALGWPVAVGRGAVKDMARRRGWSVEMAAREMRRAFLARAARRRGIPTVATAHHAGDQVELFFLRVLRGAGSAGLAGMKWAGSPMGRGITLARPLLGHSKSDLAEFARAQGVPFSEDASNASLDILRNRVRHELLPLLRAKYQPALERCVLREMELARAEGDLLSELAARWLARGRRKPLARLPVAVQRQVIQEQLHRLAQPVDFELVESLRTRPNQPVPAGPGHCLVLGANGLARLQKPERMGFDAACLRLNLNRRRRAADFRQVKLRWELADTPGMNRARRPNMEFFDADKVGARICLRHWRPGDRFHLIGAASAAKLQDIFTNLKVPRSERRRRVVAATRQGEIFWVEGLRIGEAFKLDKRTVRRLNWSWQRAGGLEKPGLRSEPAHDTLNQRT
jgi:tRNA(Ile)-lysidine synthase